MIRPLLLALAGAALALPSGASAHSVVAIQGPDVIYTSEDAISNNKLVVDETPTSIRFSDPEADSGIQGPANCATGNVDEYGYTYEVTCPKTGLQRLTVDLGPNEDSMVANMTGIAVTAMGVAGADNLKVVGSTADRLIGDQGNDILDGGAGSDTLDGGAGADGVTGGAGDDTVESADGSVDDITCGAGADTVRADTVDKVAADCEKVDRTFVAPPAGEPAQDTTKPVVRAGGARTQRVSSRRRSVRIIATIDESGVLAASGFLDAGGINTPVKTKDYTVDGQGGRVTVIVKLTSKQIRTVLRDLRRKRRVYLRVDVSGSDAAGNSTVAKRLKIRLRR